jgi:hypothetical protein
LGQVLRYRHLVAERDTTAAVVAIEREPRDKRWVALCSALGVSLVWPPMLGERLSELGHLPE